MILSKLHKDGSTTEVSLAPEEGEHNEYTALAEDFIHAYKSESIRHLAQCFETFANMIRAEDEEQDMREMGE